MPIYELDSEDTFYLSEDLTDRIQPIRVPTGEDIFFIEDNGTFKNLKFVGEDTINVSDDQPDPSAAFRRMNFPGVDTILLTDNDPTTKMKPPAYFRGTHFITVSNLAEYRNGFDVGFIDDITGWIGFPVRSKRATDNIVINDSGFMKFGFFDVGTQQDSFTMSDIGTIQLVTGPLSKAKTDNIAMTDSGTLSRSKGKTDLINIVDLYCICFEPRRKATDNITVRDIGTLRVRGKLVTPPGTLPGGGGANFKAIIRWNASDHMHLMEGHQVFKNDVLVVVETCCSGFTEPDHLGPWGPWETWGELEEWGSSE